MQPNRRYRTLRHLAQAAIAAAVVVQYGSRASATARNWNVNSGSWNVAGNWSPSGVPASGDTVTFLNSDGVIRTITYDYPGPGANLISLSVDAGTSTTSTTISMSANTLSSQSELIGNTGVGFAADKAFFNQSGGTNTFGSLTVGSSSLAQGTYTLSGTGVITTFFNGGEFIGNSGAGTFNQTGGSNSLLFNDSLFIGASSIGSGNYLLDLTGQLSVGGNEAVGFQGSGNFTQNNGSHTLTGPGSTLYLGFGSLATGAYGLNGGTLAVNGTDTNGSENIGYGGTATFNQTGGVNTAVGNITLGTLVGGFGTCTLSGGTLNANNVYVGGAGTGAAGKGILTVSGTGNLNIPNGTLKVYSTAGNAVNLSGGTMNVGTLDLSGSQSLFNWTAGTLILNAEGLGVGLGGLLGTSLTIGSNQALIENSTSPTVIANNGSVTVNGGFLSVANGNFSIGNAGTLFLNSGSVSLHFALSIGPSVGGAVQQTGGTLSSQALVLTTGTYSLSGTGNLTLLASEAITGSGPNNANFIQAGGTQAVTGDITVGIFNATGLYSLSGGTATASGNMLVGGSGSAGSNGSGLLNVTGGRLSIAQTLTVVDSQNTRSTFRMAPSPSEA